jgi:putative redox protein
MASAIDHHGLMVPISLVYRGQLRCDAEHGPSKTRLVTDAPTDNHGRGESFSPTDLIATGLGACILTTMGLVAQRDGIRVEGATVAVEKHMSAAPPRRIAKLVVRLTLPSGIAAEARQKLERAAHTCPVAISLHPDVVQEISFRYLD